MAPFGCADKPTKILLSDLLWEKNIVPAEKKQAEKDGIYILKKEIDNWDPGETNRSKKPPPIIYFCHP
jgi:hypothetical protein